MRTEQVALMLVVVALGACDMLTSAYEEGYEAGFACGTERRLADERRRDELDAWADACAAGPFVDEDTRAAAAEKCDGRNLDSVFVACRDDGLPVGSEPSGCGRFDDGLFGSCPAGVDGVCLCCDEIPARCAELGGACDDDADCCSGLCRGLTCE